MSQPLSLAPNETLTKNTANSLLRAPRPSPRPVTHMFSIFQLTCH